jgi:Tol biopolymer transport system component
VLLACALALGATGCRAEHLGASDPGPRVPARGAPAGAGAWTPPAGTIAYVSERDGRHHAYLYDTTSRETKPLDCGAAVDCYPAAAQRGALALVAAKDGPEGTHEEILLVRDPGPSQVDAARARSLGFASRMVRNPAWTPDGRGVVVESSARGFRDLYLVGRDGGAPKRLTHHEAGSFEPAISPDGRSVAFVSSREGDAEIYLFALTDPRSLRRLTWSRGDDAAPRWSPDGTRIAYVSHRAGAAVVYLMDADGARPRPLAPPGAGVLAQESPAWSPDGARIALVERLRGEARVCVVTVADGGRSWCAPGSDPPSWSPDGSALALSSDHEGDLEIYAASALDGRAHRITERPGPDWLPRWLE